VERPAAERVFEELAPRFIEQNPGFPAMVGAVVCVDVSGCGAWTVDLTDRPGVRRGLCENARCTLRISAEDFDSLFAGGSIRDWLDAFTGRRIEFSGHLPTAIKLQRLFAAVAEDPELQARLVFPDG
jgi:hypothetical protein